MALNVERPATGSDRGGPSQRRLLGGNGGEVTTSGAQAQTEKITVAVLRKGEGEVRITLDTFKGAPVVDVRLFEPFTPANVPMPTRKGVTLAIGRLPELAAALAEAETQARAFGWLDGGAQ